jgi:hypothetical protein
MLASGLPAASGENFLYVVKAAASGRCVGSAGARRLAASLTEPTLASPYGFLGPRGPAPSHARAACGPGDPGQVTMVRQAARAARRGVAGY